MSEATFAAPAPAPVDLDTCDREPIHIPGAIQPHGLLLGFDAQRRVLVRSKNAEAHLGTEVQLGAPLPESALLTALQNVLDAGDDPQGLLRPGTVHLKAGVYDVVAHRSGGLLLVEMEARSADSPPLEFFALQAQRAIVRIQQETDIVRLLEASVLELRALTGFDRVMAYRFQLDDSGVVVGEAKREDLEAFLGHRYPASDIPTQARRLYVLNPLRLIADVAYEPVAIEPALNPLDGQPLDMSFSILRSVSPVHVEYLTNMGVGASMSISIVVGNRLWGLIACHHMSPRLVPHSVRMACNLLAQVVSLLVGRAEGNAESALWEKALAVQSSLSQRMSAGGDLVEELMRPDPNLLELVPSDGVIVTLATDMGSQGETPTSESITALLSWLRARRQRDLLATHHAQAEYPEIAPLLGKARGMLVAPFFPEQDGYIIWFRNEQIENVRWGGRPEKVYTHGPLGPRLTPRGSFDEWVETVRDQSAAWSLPECSMVERLRTGMQQLALATARARIQSLENSNAELDRVTYVVSHDLRAPLRAISSLSEFIEEDMRDGKTAEVMKHLSVLRARVVRLDDLIKAILSYSRSGHGRHEIVTVEVAKLVRSVLELLAIPPQVHIVVAGDLPTVRAPMVPLQQIFLNLVSNAVKYGTVDGAGVIHVRARDRGVAWQFSVVDQGPGIGSEHFDRIFQLFNRVSSSSDGTGIGLATVRRTVEAYGGKSWVESTVGEGAAFHFTWPKETGLVLSERS